MNRPDHGGKTYAGKTVAVTGASAGIGRATAELFGRRGARVALIARGEDGLRGAADGTLAWSSTTLVVAHVTGGGRTGLGLTLKDANRARYRVA